jgi:thiol-disulfide isomerase/thioredoxin
MPRTRLTSFAATAMLTLCLLVPLARAQSANDILDASRQALAEIDGFDAQFKLSGEGGTMLNPTMPSMSGKLFFGTHDELGRVIHIIGEGKDKQSGPSKALDMVIASDRYIWTDREEKTINIAPIGSRGVPSALTLVLMDSILQADPYAKDANNADSITLGAQEEVNGFMCDQVVISRPKTNTNPRNAGNKYDQAIWWISTQDKLPRKVAQITDAGFVKVTLTFELSNLGVSDPNQDQLDVNRPESFRVVSRMPQPAPEKTTDEPTQEDTQVTPPSTNRTIPSQPAEPRGPRLPSAPTFSFKSVDDQTIDNSSQNGRISVFYFCGSWCMPCNETSPLIDGLASELGSDTLDVVALSMREGDPGKVRRTFANNYPNVTLAINPGSVANDFRVRVYPTIVVIDAEGHIVHQQSIERDLSPEDLVKGAREAIDELLVTP